MKITPPAIPVTSSTSSGGGGGSGGSGGGDVGGPIGSPTVTGLQGVPVCTDTPATNDVLTFDGTSWCPAAPTSGTAIEALDEGVSLTATLASLDFVGAGVTATAVGDAVTVTIPGGSGSLPWFNVMDYGAANDGSTDDLSAINDAIADLNAAGWGRLYFPAGAGYLTSAGFDAITAAAIICGDGTASFDYTEWGTSIILTDGSGTLFTVNGKVTRFEHMGMISDSGGTPSAGAGILVDSAYLEQRCDYEDIHVRGFYDGIDVKVGAQWVMQGTIITAPVRYGLRIRNTVNNDAGDWSISDSNFYADAYNATSAIRQESSGGGKIVNTKINMALSGNKFATGIDVAIGSGVATSVMTVLGSSIENVTGDAIRVVTTGTGEFGLATITGCQVGLYSNNTGYAVKLSAASTGGLVSGGIGGVVIDSLVARTTGTARPAISLTNTDNVVLGEIVLSGFNARYTSTGDTNTTDGAGPTGTAGGDLSGSYPNPTVAKINGVTVSGTPSAGQVVTATGASTADWETPTGRHAHVLNIVFSGDGSTTAFTLPAAPVDAYSVSVFVSGSRSQDWTLSGALLDTITFGSAPASSANNIVIDIVAAL